MRRRTASGNGDVVVQTGEQVARQRRQRASALRARRASTDTCTADADASGRTGCDESRKSAATAALASAVRAPAARVVCCASSGSTPTQATSSARPSVTVLRSGRARRRPRVATSRFLFRAAPVRRVASDELEQRRPDGARAGHRRDADKQRVKERRGACQASVARRRHRRRWRRRRFVGAKVDEPEQRQRAQQIDVARKQPLRRRRASLSAERASERPTSAPATRRSASRQTPSTAPRRSLRAADERAPRQRMRGDDGVGRTRDKQRQSGGVQ